MNENSSIGDEQAGQAEIANGRWQMANAELKGSDNGGKLQGSERDCEGREAQSEGNGGGELGKAEGIQQEESSRAEARHV